MENTKLYIFMSIILILGLILGYGIALRWAIYVPDDIKILQENSALLSNYQQGFQYCTDYCQSRNKTGYIRAITDEHHSCFCYNNTEVIQ